VVVELEVSVMEMLRMVLTPGYYAAGKLDGNYTRFVGEVKKNFRSNRREMFWLFRAAPVVEHSLVFILGIISALLGLVFPMLVMLAIYPIAGFGDMYLWRKTYGSLAENVRYLTPLLLNLDILYWLAIGYVAGWVLF